MACTSCFQSAEFTETNQSNRCGHTKMNDALHLSVYDTILAQLNRAGDFTASVLVSEDGWPIAEASASSALDSRTIAAMMALVRDFVQQTRQQLGLGAVDEVSIVIDDRSRMVCRYFGINDKSFVLVVMAQPGHTYRRLTSKAVQEITTMWISSFNPDYDAFGSQS